MRGENGPRVTCGQSRAGRCDAHKEMIPSNSTREATPVLRATLGFTTVGQIVRADQFGHNFYNGAASDKSLKIIRPTNLALAASTSADTEE